MHISAHALEIVTSFCIHFQMMRTWSQLLK